MTWRKRLRILALILITILIILWLGGLYLSTHYESIIKDQIRSKLPSSVSVNFTSLTINLFSRSVSFANVEVHYAPDSLHKEHHHDLTLDELNLKGINIFLLLKKTKLKLKQINLVNVDLTLDKLLNDSTKHQSSVFNGNENTLQEITVELFEVNRINFLLKNDSINEYEFEMSLSIRDILVPLSADTIVPSYVIDKIAINNFKGSPQNSLYKYAFRKLHYQTENLNIDSIAIKPRYSKFEYGHRVGKETDRLDLTINEMGLTHFRLEDLLDSTLRASSLTLKGITLYDFRDRRLPFIKDKDTPMPIALFKTLPFTVEIDTLLIKEAKITYEEFPEKGKNSGIIAFNHLNASLTHLHNRDSTGYVALRVKTRFMGSGNLKAKFLLPLNPSERYSVDGNLSSFDLVSLNPTLEHLAQLRISSGIMNSLSFKFSYNSIESTGDLIMNYEDLKILSLKEKEEETVINKLKTLLLNALVIKTDKDESVKKDKRSGEISFKRDPKRSIFNYWWKSLGSGIKSSYDITKILSKEEEK